MAGHYPGQFGPPPRQPRVPGPFGVPVKVLVGLLPVLTLGLLGFVPSLLLAVRRRRGVDVAAAVVFGCLFVLLVVSAAIAGHDKRQAVANGLGMGTMVVLILVPPVHFLLMDRRTVWGAPVVPAAPPYYPMAGYPGYQQPPQPQPQPPVDELQQLGELLRRQAEGGGGR